MGYPGGAPAGGTPARGVTQPEGGSWVHPRARSGREGSTSAGGTPVRGSTPAKGVPWCTPGQVRMGGTQGTPLGQVRAGGTSRTG